MQKLVLKTIGKERKVPLIYEKALEFLDRKAKNRTKSGIIRFSDVYLIFAWYMRLNKAETRIFLKELENYGLIEIIPYNGIRIRKNTQFAGGEK